MPREMVISKGDSGYRNRSLTGFLFLMLWPCASLFYGLKNYQHTIGKFLIVMLYGHAAFFYYFDFKSDLDVVRHAQRLKATEAYDASFITDRFTNFFASDKYKPDLLQPALDFIVSRFTTDYRIYFFVSGIIMACFLTAYLNKVHSYYLQRPDLYLWLMFFFVIVLVPPYRVAGFRGIVAMLFFLFAAYKARVEGLWKYNILILLSPLMHFGYLAVVPFYYLTLLIGSRFYTYLLLIVFAWLLNDIVPSYVGLFGVDVEGELGSRIRGYSSESYIESFNQSRTGVLHAIRYQMHWTVVGFFVLFISLFQKFQRADMQTKNMFSLAMAFLVLVVFVLQLEVVFVRFSIPFALLSCLVVMMLFARNSFHMGWFTKAMIAGIFIFNFVVMARKSIEFTGIEVLMPNLIASFFLDMNANILDLIK